MSGAWDIPRTDFFELGLGGRGRATWTIAGHVALQLENGEAARRVVRLEAGFHQFEITHQPASDSLELTATVAGPDEGPRPLDTHVLKPRMPRNPHLRAVGTVIYWVLGVVAAGSLVAAVRRTTSVILSRRPRPSDNVRQHDGPASMRENTAHVGRWRPTWTHWLTWSALLAITTYGALLRVDAITGRYGVVESPEWIAAVQARTFAAPESIRPKHIVWDPAPLFPHRDGPPTHYFSDPHTYLQYARELRSFYEAHRREPVFKYATHVFLAIFDGQDVAVSFASATFSILAILCT